MNTQDKKTQRTLHMAYIIETMEVAERWTFNPFKREIVCFWSKYMDEVCTIYKAKDWIVNVSLQEFIYTLVHNWKSFRMIWFMHNWQSEFN